MSYPIETKKTAIRLRKQGESIIQIGRKLHVPKSTISLWVKDVELPDELIKYLIDSSVKGREKGLRIMKAKRELQKHTLDGEARKLVKNFNTTDKLFLQLCAAIIFWCEGTKRSLSTLNFTNSDPKLIKTFLYCLRNGFSTEEKRFRALLHLHEYHNEQKQLQFWSRITKIPLTQFYKSYHKSNTQNRVRENYQGCISVRYCNAKVARKLDAIYHAFAKSIGP